MVCLLWVWKKNKWLREWSLASLTLRKGRARWRTESVQCRGKAWPGEARYWSSPPICWGTSGKIHLWVSYRGMWEWGGEHVKGNTGALTNWKSQKINIPLCAWLQVPKEYHENLCLHLSLGLLCVDLIHRSSVPCGHRWPLSLSEATRLPVHVPGERGGELGQLYGTEHKTFGSALYILSN